MPAIPQRSLPRMWINKSNAGIAVGDFSSKSTASLSSPSRDIFPNKLDLKTRSACTKQTKGPVKPWTQYAPKIRSNLKRSRPTTTRSTSQRSIPARCGGHETPKGRSPPRPREDEAEVKPATGLAGLGSDTSTLWYTLDERKMIMVSHNSK